MNIIEKYKKLKERDPKKLYLFECGNFYIFIGEDSTYINNYMVLKTTKFSNEYNKCGFPKNKIEEYKKVFKNLKLNVEIINKEEDINKIINYIKNIDTDCLSPIESLNILKKVKDLINE